MGVFVCRGLTLRVPCQRPVARVSGAVSFEVEWRRRSDERGGAHRLEAEGSSGQKNQSAVAENLSASGAAMPAALRSSCDTANR
jgi:hypothetical protein